jgi:spermidine/putrescine transport system ATP-binding protein
LSAHRACSILSIIEAALRQTDDLVVTDLTKSFAGLFAVDGVSLSLRHGEFYSLLGPSGCGKTTTLRLIAGFEYADRGRIQLAGRDITRLPPNKRRVNTVFQQYALFPHLTVQDNVAYGLRHERLDRIAGRDRLEAVLSTVRLQDLRSRYPRQLSGGQRQRVALARALVKEPTVLLLDEPLAALDLKLRKAMQEELKKLQQRVGITFLYVTHDQEEALALSDRIAVMHEGRLLQEGTPRDIYERPGSRFVADFIGETNFLEGTVEDVGSSVLVRDAETGVLLRCAPGSSVSRGDRVTVTVRPERISPVAAGARMPANVVEGRITSVTYLGDFVVHRLQFGTTSLTVQRQNSDSSATSWRPGDTVRVGWDVDGALVLADGGATDPQGRPLRGLPPTDRSRVPDAPGNARADRGGREAMT